jgi:hypothetical protein
MGGTGDHYLRGNKSRTEKQVHMISLRWNLKKVSLTKWREEWWLPESGQSKE